MLIDTHCHLDDPRLFARLPAVLAAAEASAVSGFIIPGIEPQGWESMLLLTRKNERIYAAPGVHPMKADHWSHETARVLQKLSPDIVAIGEIGLDYSAGMPPRVLQQKAFRAQLTIAREAQIPVIIHCRKAFADTLEILADERIKEFGGVMHAFSGSLEIARVCISLGLKIGIAGPVTWGNAVRPVMLIEAIPLEHLLLETDSPDLSPEPHRGEVNEPAFLVDIARTVAAIKAAPFDEVAAITSENSHALFRLKVAGGKK